MTDDLYQFQKDVMPALVAGAPTYLGFDPGLGKSRTALEAAKARGVKHLLVIAPASGRYVWTRECAKWWPQAGFGLVRGLSDLRMLGVIPDDGVPRITVITYGLLSQKDGPYANVVAKRKTPFDMTVIDEAAAVKNSAANRTKAILKKMWPSLGYVLPMSGTPAPNHAGELYPILAAHYPRAITTPTGPMSQSTFEDTFCNVQHKRFGTGRDIRVIEGSKNLPELRKRMNGYMIRVKKEDVLKDLPAIRWDTVPVATRMDVNLVPTVPAGLSDEDLLKWLSGADGEHVMRLRRMLGIAKVAGAIEYIQDFLANLPVSRKVLVFAHHRDVIAQLVAELATNHPACITGATSPDIRSKEIDTFLSDPQCRVMVANIQAAGTGLTLMGPKCKCSDVIFVEATYSVGDNHQAACRVHRIGQSDAVVARFLTAHGTIDDRIHDILARKAADFTQLFN